ncbi:MAG TPA: hypothetical protein VFQ09_08825 [Rubrobacter sp.]|nr:hypothetical protein [Rubrobacter sp.]
MSTDDTYEDDEEFYDDGDPAPACPSCGGETSWSDDVCGECGEEL